MANCHDLFIAFGKQLEITETKLKNYKRSKNMKIETLEIIIEELTAALSLERWRNKQHEIEIAALEKEIKELKAKEKENGAI